MTKDEYGDFVLRYKGCGACFPMYHTLSRFEKMWFTAIQKDVAELEKENAILRKALNLYVDWADECGIAWDNFPDMTEKWYKIVEEKGLNWIDGLIFMVTEEAKERLNCSDKKE